jgi:arginine repressor
MEQMQREIIPKQSPSLEAAMSAVIEKEKLGLLPLKKRLTRSAQLRQMLPQLRRMRRTRSAEDIAEALSAENFEVSESTIRRVLRLGNKRGETGSRKEKATSSQLVPTTRGLPRLEPASEPSPSFADLLRKMQSDENQSAISAPKRTANLTQGTI